MGTESKRVKNFRLELIKRIPKFPNDKGTLQELQQKSLTDILIIYLNWRVRLIAPRSRVVVAEDAVKKDRRWKSRANDIERLLDKVRAGDDLEEYLSKRAVNKGYTPPSGHPTSNDRWEDKDFFLNVMGLHHLHLVPRSANAQRDAHNDVMFASVSRDKFEVMGFFNHRVFEDANNKSSSLISRLFDWLRRVLLRETINAERKRLWRMYQDREERGALPGQLLIGGMGGLGIATSGQPLTVVRAAQRYVQIIREVDPKLDDRTFLQKEIYSHKQVPNNPRLQWELNHLDLGLFEESINTFFSFAKGPN
jgi:hypothetical protein